MTAQTNNVIQPRPEFPQSPKSQDAGALTNPPRSPLQGPHALQWQWALWNIRRKNQAAQANNGQRVPL